MFNMMFLPLRKSSICETIMCLNGGLLLLASTDTSKSVIDTHVSVSVFTVSHTKLSGSVLKHS